MLKRSEIPGHGVCRYFLWSLLLVHIDRYVPHLACVLRRRHGSRRRADLDLGGWCLNLNPPWTGISSEVTRGIYSESALHCLRCATTGRCAHLDDCLRYLRNPFEMIIKLARRGLPAPRSLSLRWSLSSETLQSADQQTISKSGHVDS